MIRGIRGAITLEKDTPDDIKLATIEILTKIISENSINLNDIAYAEFSITDDIKSSTPAKFARTELGWHKIPMMCYKEFEFEGGLTQCIRVLVVFNTEKTQDDIRHIYLGEAKKLRPDLVK